MSVLLIDRPGMLTTIQDAGRWGYQHWGVPVSGPMDAWSARLANRLAGNPDGTPLLEVTLLGPRFRVQRDCLIAITGAAFDVEIAGRTARSPLVGAVTRGSTVTFGQRRACARAYVAVDGGFSTPRVLGSAASHPRSGLPGLAGRPVRAGDQLTLGSPKPSTGATIDDTALLEWWSEARSGRSWTLRVLRHSWDDWSAGAFDALCGSEFIVSTDSDRMGYRLKGDVAWTEIPGALLSGPTTLGAIQVPPGGEPILLMADRQTTGGYAQVAVLSRADRQVAGQLAPGDALRFESVSWAAARDAHQRREAALDRLAPEVMA